MAALTTLRMLNDTVSATIDLTAPHLHCSASSLQDTTLETGADSRGSSADDTLNILSLTVPSGVVSSPAPCGFLREGQPAVGVTSRSMATPAVLFHGLTLRLIPVSTGAIRRATLALRPRLQEKAFDYTAFGGFNRSFTPPSRMNLPSPDILPTGPSPPLLPRYHIIAIPEALLRRWIPDSTV